MPVGCTVTVYEDHIVLLKTPSVSAGVINIRAEQSGAGTAVATLSPSTACPYLTVPAGAYNVPIGNPASINDGVEFTFAYDLSAYNQCGTALVGTLEILVDNGLECEATISIPIYVWNACDEDDVVEQCGLLLPKGIYLDAQDPSTWDALLPVISNFGYNHPEPLDQEGRNYLANISISGGSCGLIVDMNTEAQLNFDGEGHVFPIEFDLADFADCGTNLLACEITLTMDANGDPIASDCQDAGPTASFTIPVYVTNSCPERACPIGWETTSHVINKDVAATGTFNAVLNNSGASSIDVTISSTCQYITAPEDPITIAPGASSAIPIDYDVTAFAQCGTVSCGTISATVTYNDGTESCTRTFVVSIYHECQATPSDGYLTKLYDANGDSSVQIDQNCSEITIVDESDFGTLGHSVVNFSSYRKITIKHLQTNSEYVMSSIGDGDIAIPAAGAGIFTFQYTPTLSGVYEVTLCNVPTWDPSSDYHANDDVVYHNSVLYAAIGDSQGVNPETSPTASANWTVITEDEIGDYTDKYCDTQMVISSCNLNQCYAAKYKQMACDMDCNNLDLCKNKDFLNLVKLQFLLVAMEEAVRVNDMSSASMIYDKANSICTC